MPYVGIGLHLAVAIFFAVHAVRSGQQTYWLFILLSFPLLGSLIYFLTIYLPESRLRHHAGKLAAVAVKTLDPTRELRAAKEAYSYTPTAQNQIRLAQALLAAGQSKEALELFESCLKGVFSSDLEIRWGAAQAAFEAGAGDDCVRHLQVIRESNANFRADAVGLLWARAQALRGDHAAAATAFAQTVARHGNFEAKAEYAIWAAQQGDWAVADALRAELNHSMSRWGRPQRDLHRDQIKRLDAAFAGRRTA